MGPNRTSADNMEAVLALQSYSLGGGGVEDCESSQSVIVICPSSQSSFLDAFGA